VMEHVVLLYMTFLVCYIPPLPEAGQVAVAVARVGGQGCPPHVWVNGRAEANNPPGCSRGVIYRYLGAAVLP